VLFFLTSLIHRALRRRSAAAETGWYSSSSQECQGGRRAWGRTGLLQRCVALVHPAVTLLFTQLIHVDQHLPLRRGRAVRLQAGAPPRPARVGGVLPEVVQPWPNLPHPAPTHTHTNTHMYVTRRETLARKELLSAFKGRAAREWRVALKPYVSLYGREIKAPDCRYGLMQAASHLTTRATLLSQSRK
jgi:hypothetical protein